MRHRRFPRAHLCSLKDSLNFVTLPSDPHGPHWRPLRRPRSASVHGSLHEILENVGARQGSRGSHREPRAPCELWAPRAHQDTVEPAGVPLGAQRTPRDFMRPQATPAAARTGAHSTPTRAAITPPHKKLLKLPLNFNTQKTTFKFIGNPGCSKESHLRSYKLRTLVQIRH